MIMMLNNMFLFNLNRIPMFCNPLIWQNITQYNCCDWKISLKIGLGMSNSSMKYQFSQDTRI